MRRLKWSLAVTGALLGLLHAGLTAALYPQASLEALWFAGSGLGVTAVAFMNIIALRAQGRSSPIILMTANIVMAGFFAAAWSLMPAPQVALGLSIFAGLTLCDGLQLLKASSR